MKVSPQRRFWVELVCLGLFAILACAQSSDPAQNFPDCKAGRESCDRSRLSPAEAAEVAAAAHNQNVVNCRSGYDSCDPSKLTQPEATALAVADHQHNASVCKNGLQSCDKSKLTASEAQD
jgi:hypothetical protein